MHVTFKNLLVAPAVKSIISSIIQYGLQNNILFVGHCKTTIIDLLSRKLAKTSTIIKICVLDNFEEIVTSMIIKKTEFPIKIMIIDDFDCYDTKTKNIIYSLSKKHNVKCIMTSTTNINTSTYKVYVSKPTKSEALQLLNTNTILTTYILEYIYINLADENLKTAVLYRNFLNKKDTTISKINELFNMPLIDSMDNFISHMLNKDVKNICNNIISFYNKGYNLESFLHYYINYVINSDNTESTKNELLKHIPYITYTTTFSLLEFINAFTQSCA